MRRLILALTVHGALAAAAAAQTPADVFAVDAAMLADQRCAGVDPAQPGREIVMRRENNVHLDDMFVSLPVAERPTGWQTPVEQLRTGFPDAAQETIDAFLRDNSRRSRIDRRRVQALGATELSDEAHLLLSRTTDFWQEFHRRFPRAGSIVELAQVAVSPQRTEAIAYCSHRSGSLGGLAGIAFLRRDEDRWTIVRWIVLWIS